MGADSKAAPFFYLEPVGRGQHCTSDLSDGGLTTAAYLAIPVAAPIALGGFYSYHGMSFYEVTRRRIRQLFFNRTLLYRSPERNETENRKKKKRQKKKRRGET